MSFAAIEAERKPKGPSTRSPIRSSACADCRSRHHNKLHNESLSPAQERKYKKRPVASPSPQGSNEARTLLIDG
jgi:hypothetical protein